MSKSNRGQATVELALTLPILCLVLLGVVQVAVIVADSLGVHLASRSAARAASVSAAPPGAGVDAANGAVGLSPLNVSIRSSPTMVTARVTFVDHTTVPLIGLFIPDVTVSATTVMALEPP